MADTKISDLTAGSAVAATDVFPAVETAGTGPVKKTAAQLKTFAQTNPAGSGSELQYRSSGTAFGALSGSSVSGSVLTLAALDTPTVNADTFATFFVGPSAAPVVTLGGTSGEGITVRGGQFFGISSDSNDSSHSKRDTVLTRVAAGVFKVSDNSTGAGVIVTQAVTVSALPSAATAGVGARAFVTDANATTRFSTVAGGGTNKLSVFSDGTNWLIQ